MFKNQPAGLYVLALANTGERFGYYTMLFRSCCLLPQAPDSSRVTSR